MSAPSKPRAMKPHTSIVGSKFEATRDMDAADVAKLVRVDIKASIEAGTLPPGKYAVRSSTSQMEIGVSISDVREPGFKLYNAARLAWQNENPYASLSAAPIGLFALYSDRAHAIVVQVEAILASYNRSIRSNEADDYRNDHFHCEVDFGGSWSSDMREREEAVCALAMLPTERAPAMSANDTTSEHAAYLAHLGAL